jgi:hypothetical protein
LTDTKTYRPLIEPFTEEAERLGYDLTLRESETLGWKSVRPDFTTRAEFRWPFPGSEPVTCPDATEHADPCPQFPGDGLCIASNARGARSGGIRLGTVLLVAWSGLLAESDDKLRVRSARVLALIDATRANLWGADLRGADLGGADLGGADASTLTSWPDGFDPSARGVVVA